MILTKIALALLLVGLAFVFYFAFVRNALVHDFRKSIIDQVFTGDNWQRKHEIFHNGPSYDRMVMSFKPLKLESFYTPEQIEILNK